MLIQDPLFWGLALFGLLIVGVSKGGFGGGLGVVGVPFLAAAIPVNQAAAIMLPCLIIMDITGLYGWRGQWCWIQLRRLLPAAALGVCLGGLGFHGLSDNALRVMIGGIGLGFGLQWWIQHLGLNHRSEPSLPSAWHTRFLEYGCRLHQFRRPRRWITRTSRATSSTIRPQDLCGNNGRLFYLCESHEGLSILLVRPIHVRSAVDSNGFSSSWSCCRSLRYLFKSEDIGPLVLSSVLFCIDHLKRSAPDHWSDHLV